MALIASVNAPPVHNPMVRDLDIGSSEIVSVGGLDIFLHSDESIVTTLGDTAGGGAFIVANSADTVVGQITSRGELRLGTGAIAVGVGVISSKSTNLQIARWEGTNTSGAYTTLNANGASRWARHFFERNAGLAGSVGLDTVGNPGLQAGGAVTNAVALVGTNWHIGTGHTTSPTSLARGLSMLLGVKATSTATDVANIVMLDLDSVAGTVTPHVQTEDDLFYALDGIQILTYALSDETTALTTGTAKLTVRAPFAMTLFEVRASVVTAPTGSTIIVDINDGGTTILSTKLSIDASEKTSTTAASATVISDTAISDDAEITFDIDQVGATIAGTGLKVSIYCRKAPQ